VLRPSLLPGLVDSVGHNLRHGRRDVRLFEIGARFSPIDGERNAIALAWTGEASLEHWSARPRDVDLFDVKGIVERLCQALGLAPTFEATTRTYLVAGRTASFGGPGVRGVLGQLAPLTAARSLSESDAIYVAEMDVHELADRPRRETEVQPIPRHPSSGRDLSILVHHRLPAAKVRGTILAAAPPTLVEIREFDRYTGQGIPDDRVSLSFHLTFRSSERTLTDAEVQGAMTAIVAALAERHGAVQR
jgi:phenylalanyl-tRNA synthetase beta chain